VPIGATRATITRDLEGLAPPDEDEPVARKSPACAAEAWRGGGADEQGVAAARAEGITGPSDLARKAFAVTRKLARERGAG
jgi:hypothetical protein